ncbi:MAG: AEC family transporter, partial [Pseudomonadota bacterium]
FAAKKMNVDRKSLGVLTLYFFQPVVIFGFILELDFQPAYIILPVFLYIITVIIGTIFLHIGKYVFKDMQANIMALCSSMSNMGYLGLPLVILFFDEKIVALYIFMTLGGTLVESTFGYYIAARGTYDITQSFKKILTLPAIYAIILGFLFKSIDLGAPDFFWTYWSYFKGAYIIVGMMIVGAALTTVQKFVFGPYFLTLTFIGKFIIFPLLSYGFIILDQNYFGLLSTEIYQFIMILSVLPPAANIATFAIEMNLQPEKAATTILMGTILSMIILPIMIILLGL